MAKIGLNVGSTMSLEDMNLAIDYLQDKELYETKLQDIKEKLGRKEKEITLNEIEKIYK
jgi:hypothetical protein